MAGETEMHKLLKKEACRWLYRMGYRSIAAEVRLSGLGIVDAVGTGLFRPNHNYLFVPQSLHQTVFIECKASRADFLRDVSEDGQLTLALMERSGNRRRRRRRKCLSQRVGLGKFAACLAAPMANLHYILAPAGMLQRKDLPPRWGLLSFGEGGISVVVRPDGQEQARGHLVESAIARTLTMDIYRADDRAMASVNRQIMNQQAQLAERIRQMKIVLAEPEGVSEAGEDEAGRAEGKAAGKTVEAKRESGVVLSPTPGDGVARALPPKPRRAEGGLGGGYGRRKYAR
jgi:hypothetical protein